METQAKKQKKLNLYADFKNDIKQHPDYFTAKEASIWENSWFYQNTTTREDYRMCIVISLAVYEIEKDNISKAMIDEVDYYFDEVFVQRSFDDVFTDKEAETECFEDIRWCYDRLKEKGLL